MMLYREAMHGESESRRVTPCPHCGEGHAETLLVCPRTDLVLPLSGRLLNGSSGSSTSSGRAVWVSSGGRTTSYAQGRRHQDHAARVRPRRQDHGALAGGRRRGASGIRTSATSWTSERARWVRSWSWRCSGREPRVSARAGVRARPGPARPHRPSGPARIGGGASSRDRPSRSQTREYLLARAETRSPPGEDHGLRDLQVLRGHRWRQDGPGGAHGDAGVHVAGAVRGGGEGGHAHGYLGHGCHPLSRADGSDALHREYVARAAHGGHISHSRRAPSPATRDRSVAGDARHAVPLA